VCELEINTVAPPGKNAADREEPMKINSNIFAAYLKCPTKCWLRAKGERLSGNTYAEWVATQNAFYRATGIERLVARFPNHEIAFSPSAANVQAAKWLVSSITQTNHNNITISDSGVSDPKQAADRTKEAQERVSAAALSNLRSNMD
jgi:hypothetical protein